MQADSKTFYKIAELRPPDKCLNLEAKRILCFLSVTGHSLFPGYPSPNVLALDLRPLLLMKY